MKLIASELVTNAMVHSGCTEEDEVELQLDRTDHHLLLSVVDPGRSGGRAELTNKSEPLEPGGMGLHIVDHLANRWGAERSDGYRVWAELSLTAPPSDP